MIIDCISDLHGYYPKLEGGDLLIVGGDLTAKDTFEQHGDFKKWLYEQKYKKKIVIAGNHDNYFVGLPSDPHIFSDYNIKTGEQLSYAEYLCDSGTEYEGMKIWGSPWTKTFEGMNPLCKAFTLDTEEELAKKWALIPDNIDILITHSPTLGFLDKTINDRYVGSESLKLRIWGMYNPPKLVVCGHIHEAYGKDYEKWGECTDEEFNQIFVNASHVNERYEPVNKPIRVIL